MPSYGTPGLERGYLIPIGGAERKDHRPEILTRFVDVCGGEEARIAVIPTASELDDTGDRYQALFEELGAEFVTVLPVTRRQDAERLSYLDELERCNGIFITGGNQLRLSTILGGTRLAKAIRKHHADGVHVAGTSAGAAIMPEHMIAGGRSGPTPTEDGVVLAPGLGLTNKLMIDQHFRQRDRLGRLLTAVSFNPFALAVGVDEDTALFVAPNGVGQVVGSGAVTVVDSTDLAHSSMDRVRPGEPISLVNLRVHVLAHGARIDTATRQVLLNEDRVGS